MAQGKQIGNFRSLTSQTFTPGPDNTMTVLTNFEGPTTGVMAGLHRGTLSVAAARGGRYARPTRTLAAT
jgi:hypothetical protein